VMVASPCPQILALDYSASFATFLKSYPEAWPSVKCMFIARHFASRILQKCSGRSDMTRGEITRYSNA